MLVRKESVGLGRSPGTGGSFFESPSKSKPGPDRRPSATSTSFRDSILSQLSLDDPELTTQTWSPQNSPRAPTGRMSPLTIGGDMYHGRPPLGGSEGGSDRPLSNLSRLADPSEDTKTADSESPKPKVSALASVLFFLLGLATFVQINGLWSEIPLFVTRTPEGLAIGTYIGVAQQLANIVPFAYMALLIYVDIRDTTTILGIIILAIVNGLCITFFWGKTAVIGGQDHSVALLVTTFVGGVVGGTSMLVFWSFTSNFPEYLTTMFSTGMGGSGLIPTLLALAQNAGGTPRFSAEVYFAVNTALLVLSLVSFLVVSRSQYGNSLRKVPIVKALPPSDLEGGRVALLSVNVDDQSSDSEIEVVQPKPRSNVQLLRAAWNPILNQFWTNVVMYFAIPGILPFITDRFHNGKNVLMWLMLIFMAANTFGRVVTSYVRFQNMFLLNFLQTVVFGYFFVSAVGAKASFTRSYVFDEPWIVMISVFVFSCLNGYTLTEVYVLVVTCVEEHERERICRWAAVFEQVGAVIGSLSCFLAVQVHWLQ